LNVAARRLNYVVLFSILQYLQGKRGIEKPPFDLPEFIKKTGIMEMRAALQEKEDQRTLKAKMRERARPKLGKIDIDYQKLHDAFFKYGLFYVPNSTV
jgi:splicing factor 3B subunit 2